MRLEAGEAGFSPALTTKVQQSQELSLEKRRWLQQLVIQPGHVAEFQLRVDLTIHELQLGRAVGRQFRPGNSARRVTFSVLWVVYGWM